MGLQPTSDVRLARFASERKISVEWLNRAGVEMCPEDGEYPGWVRIPYNSVTHTWHYKYRSLNPQDKPKYMASSGSEVHLYNPYHLGPGASEIWFAEGEFDTIVLNELGYPAIGIPGVGHIDKMLNSVWLRLYRGARIYVAFDGDKYGHEAAVRLKDGLDKHGMYCKLVHVPDGHDINSWYAEDEDGLRQALDNERV